MNFMNKDFRMFLRKYTAVILSLMVVCFCCSCAKNSVHPVKDPVIYEGDKGEETIFPNGPVADVSFVSSNEYVVVNVSSVETVVLSIMKAGDEKFSDVPLLNGSAKLDVAKGEMAEVRVTDGKTSEYKTYYIDRSGDTDTGYFYTSLDNAVMAYVTTDELSSYTFVADNTSYRNGEYVSVNQATWITSDNDVGFDSGEIYSVASCLAEIDFTSIKWFKHIDGKWIALATDYSEEENMNIGAHADLDGEGLYVLMATEPAGGISLPAENLTYTQCEDRDGVVFLTFDDPNTNSKYYNVYYSESAFNDKNADDVFVRSFPADSTNLTINLLERNRTVYAAVEIVAENGKRSELVDIVLTGSIADSDHDGIPDWYCDKFFLWNRSGEYKDIANSDDDSDGLSNLDEYLIDSNPRDPDDPVHTTNIPVDFVYTSEGYVFLDIGQMYTVNAFVSPDDATTKGVVWSCEDVDVVTIDGNDSVCSITAVASGRAKIYVESLDGGYVDVIEVIVS